MLIWLSMASQPGQTVPETVISDTFSSVHSESFVGGRKRSVFTSNKRHVEGNHSTTTKRTLVNGKGEEHIEECTGGDCHEQTTPITARSLASTAHAAGDGIIHPSYPE